EAAVAGRAEDVEAPAAAEQQLARRRHRQLGDDVARRVLAGGEGDVLAEMAARHGAFGELARGHAVGEELRRLERLVARLVVHVLAAAPGAGSEHGECRDEGNGAVNTPPRKS